MSTSGHADGADGEVGSASVERWYEPSYVWPKPRTAKECEKWRPHASARPRDPPQRPAVRNPSPDLSPSRPATPARPPEAQIPAAMRLSQWHSRRLAGSRRAQGDRTRPRSIPTDVARRPSETAAAKGASAQRSRAIFAGRTCTDALRFPGDGRCSPAFVSEASATAVGLGRPARRCEPTGCVAPFDVGRMRRRGDSAPPGGVEAQARSERCRVLTGLRRATALPRAVAAPRPPRTRSGSSREFPDSLA
jgi:hypothetical protein